MSKDINDVIIDTESTEIPDNLDEILKEGIPNYHGHGGVDDLFRMESYKENGSYADEFEGVEDLDHQIYMLKLELLSEALA